MSHELERLEDGSYSFAFAGNDVKPWHGLGVEVHNDLSPQEMLVKAGLDWSVEKVPMYANYRGESVSTNAEALIRDRDHKVLSIVTDTWNPCQNQEAFEFFNDFVGAGNMEMNTAGSIMGGRTVFALAKVKDSFELFGGDKVDSYLLFSNPHQFGKSITVQFTPIRVVCNNTLSLALNSKATKMVKVNHRRLFNGDEVKQALGIAHDKLVKYKEMAEFLGSKKAKNEDIVEYFNRIFPKTSSKPKEDAKATGPESRNAKICMDILDKQPGAEFAEGTWWPVFNSLTFFLDHLSGRSADTRLNSSWYGPNQQKKVDGLNLAVEMAEASV